MSGGAWVNVGCGIFRAPEPWVNLDVVHVEGHTEPDVIVDDFLDPLRRGTVADWYDTIERVYMGHVLEHIPYREVVPWLVRIRERMISDGAVVIVGPDVMRSTDALIAGTRDREWWWTNFEDDWDHYNGNVVDAWAGERHQWNCYEHRVVRLLEAAGFVHVHGYEMVDGLLPDWPLVSHSPEQFAVTARTP